VTHPALPQDWQQAQQQWNRVHGPLQQQQQQRGGAAHRQQQQQGSEGSEGAEGVLSHLSGGTAVLLGSNAQHTGRGAAAGQQQQQQQQQQPPVGVGGVCVGASRQASVSTLAGEPQPPRKRLHTTGDTGGGVFFGEGEGEGVRVCVWGGGGREER